MATAPETNQTIARLTPLADVLAMVERDVKPVAPRSVDLDAAGGRVLAEDVVPARRPESALALLDGWALAADATLGAGGYSPVLLPHVPRRIEVGQPMPAGTDCVAPFDDVKVTGGQAEVLTTLNPGDGVLPAGGDCDGTALRSAGERLRAIDRATLGAAGIARVVVRDARFVVAPLRASKIVGAAGQLVARDILRRGGSVRHAESGDLDSILKTEGADAIVAIGGTGQGRDDSSAQMLRSNGPLVAHGIALSPGETAAFGFVGTKPVLLLPGRLDAALAVWLTLGRRMLARLTAHSNERESSETLPLARKVTSTVGMAELVPLRRNAGTAEPLARQYLSLTVLARADGWLLVPADSEGYAVGTPVRLRSWP
jgi:molybdopterin molybdotransferase